MFEENKKHNYVKDKHCEREKHFVQHHICCLIQSSILHAQVILNGNGTYYTTCLDDNIVIFTFSKAMNIF